MKILLHLGAHCTDGDQILKCLRQNLDKLGEQGIAIPEPGKYRPVIREALQAIRDEEPTAEMQEILLDSILTEDDPERVFLSHDSFLGVPGRAIGHDMLYPMTAGKAPKLRKLFRDCEMEFLIGLRNPATFIPEVFERAQEDDFEMFLGSADPIQLRWSNLIARLRTHVPDAGITVWCNEDTPMMWTELLQAITDHDEHTVLDGIYDFVGSLLSRGGRNRMQTYLSTHAPKTAAQRQRILSAFLEKFALDGVIEQEIDLPGWSDSYVRSLTELYDDDCALIEGMEGVRFIKP